MITALKKRVGPWKMFHNKPFTGVQVRPSFSLSIMSKTKKRMLITGVSGLLGNNLAYYFKDKYKILGLYLSHPVIMPGMNTTKCDLSINGPIKEIIADFNPSIVIHCASLTSVDRCEIEMDLADKMNVLSTRNLVDSLREKDAQLVYISTDSVYDGVKGDFSEDDDINPLNHYGRTKYEGEVEVFKREKSFVLRTNIFGWNMQDKRSLGEWMLGELQSGRKINCFTDARFSSIYTMELARVIDIATQYDIRGLYNCGSVNSCSKYEFAMKIADVFGLHKELINPILIEDFMFTAKRGKNLSLNSDKLQRTFNYRLPTIDHSIEMFYRDHRCGLPEMLKKYSEVDRPASVFLPYGKQWIDDNDVQAVTDVLLSERITQGPVVEEFEKALADYTGAKYAVAVNSGTAALHIACLAAGIELGDEVITSPITFVASANCVLYCGGRPVFADVYKNTYNIDPDEIKGKITSRTKVLIPVHFAGQSCDMESIYAIVKASEQKYGHKIYIIEDACHALGSLYKNKRVGSCTYSDMTVMSFHPVKHITTGEGGVALTNDETLYKKLKKFRSHGITSNPKEFVNIDFAFRPSTTGTQTLANPWYYEQIDLGYNYRITDIQCALGLSQLKKLDLFRARRREIVDTYNAAFKDSEFITIPFEDNNCKSNFHLYVLLFDFEKMNIDRAQFMSKLKERDIQTQVHYIPVYLQPYYRKRFESKPGDCPNAESYYRGCLSIPLFPAMTDKDVEWVISSIKSIC